MAAERIRVSSRRSAALWKLNFGRIFAWSTLRPHCSLLRLGQMSSLSTVDVGLSDDGSKATPTRLAMEILIVAALNRAMDEDDAKGARGAWAAVLGFSQGAKVAASWLFKQQQLPLKQDEEEKGPLGQMVNPQRAGFRFGILMAGRGPLLELAPKRRADGGDAKDGFLSLRTIHVHGLHDPGLEAHRQMLRDCCVSGSTRLVEWMGDHRLPIKSRDVKLVVDSIVVTAKELGVLV